MNRLLILVLTVGCAGAADDAFDALTDPVTVADAGPPAADAAPDAATLPVESTTCCRLTNERGELLNNQCAATGVLNIEHLEGRGYRCWLVD